MHTVVFDVDDTLYDQHLPFINAFKEQLSTQFTNKELYDLYIASRKYSDEVFEQEQRGDISTLDLQIYRIKQATHDFDYDITNDQAIRFQDAYVKEQKKITLFPEMEALLDFLTAQHIQVAVLTNGNTDHQQMKIDQLNLTKWVKEEHCFISGTIGTSKPDSAIFEHIEKQLNINPESTWYIGDSYENDVVGAKRANWHVVWFNHRKRQAPDTPLTPDKIISDRSNLLPFFKSNILID